MNITEISLNEEVLKPTRSNIIESQKLESIGENEGEYVTRSEPNIQSEIHNEEMDVLNDSLNTLRLSDDNLANKRAESEPLIHLSMTNWFHLPVVRVSYRPFRTIFVVMNIPFNSLPPKELVKQ